MRRVKAHDHHKGHAGRDWQMREQLRERFEAAGGGSYADYHERAVSGLLILGAAIGRCRR
jgi:hypothetical protein